MWGVIICGDGFRHPLFNSFFEERVVADHRDLHKEKSSCKKIINIPYFSLRCFFNNQIFSKSYHKRDKICSILTF